MRRNLTIEEYRERFREPLAFVLQRLRDMFPGLQVDGRVKSVSSIEEKLQRKGGTVVSLYDIAATRVIFPNIPAVYEGVKKIRRGFRVIDEENFIEEPKHGYRSYHIDVLVAGGYPVEIQLKTPRMLEWSRMGHYGFPAYKKREELRRQFGSEAKKMEKYYQRMAQHYYWTDIGEKRKRPKVPTAWKRAGIPLLTLNPLHYHAIWPEMRPTWHIHRENHGWHEHPQFGLVGYQKRVR